MSEDCAVTVIGTYVNEKVTFVTMNSQGFFWSLLRVMAGLVPAIHVLLSCGEQDVDARNKCGHDELNERVV